MRHVWMSSSWTFSLGALFSSEATSFCLHFYLSLFRELSHISILSLNNSHTFQFSLWTSSQVSILILRNITHFNSLFGQVSQVSILSFEKSHTFQFSLLTSLRHFQSEYWIPRNEFLFIRLASNLSNKELGSQALFTT